MAPSVQREVCYVGGCYRLQGDGATVACQWVSVPTAPAPPPGRVEPGGVLSHGHEADARQAPAPEQILQALSAMLPRLAHNALAIESSMSKASSAISPLIRLRSSIAFLPDLRVPVLEAIESSAHARRAVRREQARQQTTPDSFRA